MMHLDPWIICPVFLLAHMASGYFVPAPYNITIEDITDHGITVHWLVMEDISGVEIMLAPITRSGALEGNRRFIVELPNTIAVYTMMQLHGDVVYELWMKAYNHHGAYSNASDVILFRTPIGQCVCLSNGTEVNGKCNGTSEFQPIQVAPFEVIVVGGIIVAWLFSIVLFVNSWNKIRISPPGETPIKPKNLHRIKVVKRSTDSVIYRARSSKYKSTMAAREKRIIARMNTMPAIKLDLSIFETIHEDSDQKQTQLPLQNSKENKNAGPNGKIIL